MALPRMPLIFLKSNLLASCCFVFVRRKLKIFIHAFIQLKVRPTFSRRIVFPLFLNKIFSIQKSNTDLHSQFRSSYYTFFGSCCYKTEKFWANLCFDSSEHSALTADDNNKVSNFTDALALNILRSVLYFNSTIINNQIRVLPHRASE